MSNQPPKVSATAMQPERFLPSLTEATMCRIRMAAAPAQQEASLYLEFGRLSTTGITAPGAITVATIHASHQMPPVGGGAGGGDGGSGGMIGSDMINELGALCR